jgi:DnaK suppressor protein
MNHVTITAPETDRRKKALHAKMRELTASSVVREELQLEYLADPLDQIVSNTNREIAMLQIDHQARLVRDVELALEAIEDGTYGVCERCEQAIPRPRLDAVPWARLCVPCQSVEEAAGPAGDFRGMAGEEFPALTYAA